MATYRVIHDCIWKLSMKGISITVYVESPTRPRRAASELAAPELAASCRAVIDQHRRRAVGNTRSSMYARVYETIPAAYADAASTQLVSITDTRSRNDWRAHTRLSAGGRAAYPRSSALTPAIRSADALPTFHEAGHIRHRRNFHQRRSPVEPFGPFPERVSHATRETGTGREADRVAEGDGHGENTSGRLQDGTM
jgi:hypothetical protein